MGLCYIVIGIHFLISLISYWSFTPNTSIKNKSDYQIAQAQKYDKLFRKNFPFLSSYSGLFFFGPFFYFSIYFWLGRIDIVDEPLKTAPFITIIMFSLSIMTLLLFKISDEYHSRDFEIKNKHPFIGLGIYIYIFSVSILCGFTITHFGNYALDFSTGEEHIVTITKSVHYTTRGPKRGVNHHYEIHFMPQVGGHEYLDVPSSLQQRAKENDQLKLYVKNGFFGIPYISSRKELNKE